MGTWCGGLAAAQQELLDTSCRANADCDMVPQCCGVVHYVPQGMGDYYASLGRNMKEDCVGVAPASSAEQVCNGQPNLPGACIGGHCQACLQGGGKCTDGSECCSLACLEGECACGLKGRSCRSGADCCSGICGDPDQRSGSSCQAYCL
jgi:hypothetical protein